MADANVDVKLEFSPGVYILRETVYSQELCSLKESFNATVGTLYANSSVKVSEVAESENCVRGKIENGWITIFDRSKSKPAAALILHADFVDFATQIRAKFQPRYLVLTSDNQLSVYTDDTMRALSNTLDMKKTEIQVGEQGFQLKSGYKTWIFSPDENQKQQWLNVLNVNSGEEGGKGEGEPGTPAIMQDQRAELLRRPSAPALPSDPESIPLPPNWAMAKDVQGRTYYIDHVSRTTQWTHPSL